MKLTDTLLVRWLDTEKKAPSSAFLMFYFGFVSKTENRVKPGESYLVTLVPTGDQGSFATTTLRKATIENVNEVRRALKEMK